MRFSQRLELRQGQSLVMTPQLLQAIKLLQFSSLELQNYVEAELERNPLLERDDPDRNEQPAAQDAEGASDYAGSASDYAEGESGYAETGSGDDFAASDGEGWSAPELTPERGEIDVRTDADLGNVFQDEHPVTRIESQGELEGLGLSAGGWSGVGGTPGGDDPVSLEAYVAAQATMQDFLGGQLTLATQDPVDLLIGQTLIDLIDEAGYLSEPLAGTADRLGVSLARTEAVLSIIHTFEPAGIGARNLAECLRLQLVDSNRYDPAMAALLDNLDLLARRDFTGLKRVCGVDDEDLKEMVSEIRRLDPKPGLRFGGGPIQPVVPDVYVRQGPDGGWVVELNSDVLPRVLVNQSYLAKVAKSAKSEPEKVYLTDCLQTASWLTRSLEQRAQDDSQGRDRDRAAAGRLPRPRRRASAAVESAHRRRRDRDARIHRFPGDLEQVRCHTARRLRDEVLLHRRDRRDTRRRRPTPPRPCGTASSK